MNEPRFIPCGDSFEKIGEIDEAALQGVSGSIQPQQDTFSEETKQE